MLKTASGERFLSFVKHGILLCVKIIPLLASGKSNVTVIPTKHIDRPWTRGNIGERVQMYIKAMRTADPAVSAPVVVATAQGTIEAKNRTMFKENDGSIHFISSWANS